MKKNILDFFTKYYLCFMFYACFGWLYEVFLEVVVYQWGFSNRGVLFGPYCPVYGVGALLFIFLVYPLIKDKAIKQKLLYVPLIFLLCMLSATVLELMTSYLCEFFMGSWPWQTYARDYVIHFQGRIALSPSLRFGLGGLLFLYGIQPLLEKVICKANLKIRYIVSFIILIVFIIDMICTFLL